MENAAKPGVGCTLGPDMEAPEAFILAKAPNDGPDKEFWLFGELGVFQVAGDFACKVGNAGAGEDGCLAVGSNEGNECKL